MRFIQLNLHGDCAHLHTIDKYRGNQCLDCDRYDIIPCRNAIITRIIPV